MPMIFRIMIVLLLCGSVSTNAEVPHIFADGDVISAQTMNENFDDLSKKITAPALNPYYVDANGESIGRYFYFKAKDSGGYEVDTQVAMIQLKNISDVVYFLRLDGAGGLYRSSIIGDTGSRNPVYFSEIGCTGDAYKAATGTVDDNFVFYVYPSRSYVVPNGTFNSSDIAALSVYYYEIGGFPGGWTCSSASETLAASTYLSLATFSNFTEAGLFKWQMPLTIRWK